jgi:UDP-N-acetylmuramyl pentapeptide synthase
LAARAALELLKNMPLEKKSAQRWAILGDMLELGNRTEEEHWLLGQYLAELGIDKLVTVGERARDIARGAKAAGLAADDVFVFTNHQEAGHFIQNRLQIGDIVLVKGSQGARMERVVKEIMAEPERSAELLVRQDEQWIDLGS